MRAWWSRNKYFLDLGRRSWFLILFAIMYLCVAATSLSAPYTREPLFIHEILPGWLRIGVWLVGGLLALFGALIRKPKYQVHGFVGLCIPTAWRDVSYFLGIFTSFFHNPDERHLMLITGIAGFVIYSLLLSAVLIVASWPEPNAYILRSGTHVDLDDRPHLA